jgi:hypothetical protein
MSFKNLNTGFNIQGVLATGLPNGDPCAPVVEPCTLYNPNRDEEFSLKVMLTTPRQFRAFGLQPGETFTLYAMKDTLREPLRVGGRNVQLDYDNNYLLIASPGDYIFRFEGQPGEAWLFCEPIECCNADIVSRGKLMGDNNVL